MKTRKVMTLALVLATVAGTTIAQTRRKPQADTTITNLQARMEQLTTELGSLKSELAASQQTLGLLTQKANQSAADEKISTVDDRVTGINERLLTAESDVAGLKKLKVSGYIQARYEYLDYRPLNDGATTNNKLGVTSTSINGSQGASDIYIRRGRIKFVYTPGPLSQYCLYFDASKNTVSLKEAWVTLNEPWTGRRFSLTMGQMNWPFGIEIERSSSVREVPERSQMANALFNGERDRGVKLTGSPINNLTVDLGIFNGWGINNSTFTWQDPTRQKDFIGRVKYDLGFAAVSFSYYNGETYVPAGSTVTLKSSVPASGSMTTTTTTADKRYYKGRISGGLEAYYQLLPFGSTAVLAEGLMGKELGKNVEGGYAMLIQNIGDKLNLAFRGDMYNNDKSAGKYNHSWVLTPAVNYWWDDAVRLTLAYDWYRTNSDLMMQHSNPLLGYKAGDSRNTNKVTFQVQFKF